jgi:antitoxin component YwqK of YwqJK toxin-antitoxin module
MLKKEAIFRNGVMDGPFIPYYHNGNVRGGATYKGVIKQGSV